MYPYITLALITGCVWLILFVLRKSERTKMLVLSIAVIPFIFFDYFSQPIYWHPHTLFSIPIGIESVLFGLAFGGVAGVLYSEGPHKHGNQIRMSIDKKNIIALSPILIIAVGCYFLFHINIMLTLPIGLLAGCIIMMIMRRDLIKRILYSGLYFGVVYFIILWIWFMIFPQAREWWNLEIYANITILHVPLGEVLFGFLFGGLWGAVYEFLFIPKIE